jgi:7-cyano-7-deazaguanine reductase
VALFQGWDIWNGYELSWLNNRGKPQIAIIQVVVPYDSDALIESKSFKLYLNSFNSSRFESVEDVKGIISSDLSQCAGSKVDVRIISASDFSQFGVYTEQSICIDDIDISITDYQPNRQLLKTHDKLITESLHSHLLKSNCLITNQPDWATIEISYQGPAIDHGSLLAYLISFRDHNEFHEQCVERVFCDIMEKCKPTSLTVYAKYTRRGGLDINPFRSTESVTPYYNRHCRQ